MEARLGVKNVFDRKPPYDAGNGFQPVLQLLRRSARRRLLPHSQEQLLMTVVVKRSPVLIRGIAVYVCCCFTAVCGEPRRRPSELRPFTVDDALEDGRDRSGRVQPVRRSFRLRADAAV